MRAIQSTYLGIKWAFLFFKAFYIGSKFGLLLLKLSNFHI